MSEQLQRGIALARAGKKGEARALLTQVVEYDEQNELAWLWLSGVVDDPEDMRVCLENVLALNPDNMQARQGLEWLIARYGERVDTTPAEVQPLHEEEEYEQLEAEPAPIAASSEPAQKNRAAFDEDLSPCPYCGTATAAMARACVNCHRPLLVRDTPAKNRSIWLTSAAWLHFLNALFYVLSAGLLFVSTTLLYQLNKDSHNSLGNGAVISTATYGVLVLVFGGIIFWVGRALLQRLLWAYYVAIGLIVFDLIALLIGFSQRANISIPTPPTASQTATNPGMVGIITAVILFGLLLTVILAALLGAAYRDFFGPYRRFKATFKPTDHASHYNNGVAYKNRGMWYMAMREWELAVSRAPFDLNYLHALGLAYAQIRRFDDARATLDKALNIAPNHRQISESRLLVEQMASKP